MPSLAVVFPPTEAHHVEIRGSDGGEDVHVALLACNAVWTVGIHTGWILQP